MSCASKAVIFFSNLTIYGDFGKKIEILGYIQNHIKLLKNNKFLPVQCPPMVTTMPALDMTLATTYVQFMNPIRVKFTS